MTFEYVLNLHLCICVLICTVLHLPLCECMDSHACMHMSVSLPAYFSLHILIMSPWSNYSAACITLSMWHTISRQLTWASQCQPIGCAITLLSDISIIRVLPCFTLKQQDVEIKPLPACPNVEICVALSVSLPSYIRFSLLIWYNLFLPPTMSYCSWTFSLSSLLLIFLLQSNHPPGIIHPFVSHYLLIPFLPVIRFFCPLFASFFVCSFIWKRSMSCTKKKYDVSAEKNKSACPEHWHKFIWRASS